VIYNTLNQKKVKNLSEGKYADGQGIWLIKRSKNAGKWVLRLNVSGKRREMGLGPWPDVSISEARGCAAAARRKLREGFDPIEERQMARVKQRRLTVSEAIDGCFQARQAELKKDGYTGRWMSPLNVHVIPKLGKPSVEEINQHQIVRILEPIWHTKPESASKALNRINLTLKHAAALGLDVDLQATMKARALLGKQRHKVTHIPSIPYPEMPEFYSWLCEKELTSSLALRFLILTAARTREVRFARHDEIRDDIWLLPSERTKTGQEHRVPLSSETLKVIHLTTPQSISGFVFPTHSGKAMSDAAMPTFMKREGHTSRPA